LIDDPLHDTSAAVAVNLHAIHAGDGKNYFVASAFAQGTKPEAVQLGRIGEWFASGTEELTCEFPRTITRNFDGCDRSDADGREK